MLADTQRLTEVIQARNTSSYQALITSKSQRCHLNQLRVKNGKIFKVHESCACAVVRGLNLESEVFFRPEHPGLRWMFVQPLATSDHLADGSEKDSFCCLDFDDADKTVLTSDNLVYPGQIPLEWLVAFFQNDQLTFL
ncbi:hypothetical protein AVEN_86921-1 [Araneus ventricosus]|uniref:Uncharacterized protein n=1 Tax=Araneus ventricosus TaxID=182803 RepID=A0A4Y2QUU1_ARAVE|nr:hypothetical protein AVEN_86921-1 [Araneus ventricosus]